MTQVSELWTHFSNIQGNIVAGLITAAIAILGYYLRPRVRLRWGRANASFHEMKAAEKPVHLNVEKHYLQNTGRKPAHNVEFVFTYQPSELSVWEPRDYSTKATPEGHYVLSIPQIAPGELLIIDSIYVNTRAAAVISVKCADCLGKEVEFRVMRFFGNAFNLIIGSLVLVGFFYVLTIATNFVLNR